MSNGLKKETVEKILQLFTEKADKAHRDISSGSLGGVIGNVLDDCRRIVAEAARADGLPNLDRFYGRLPIKRAAEYSPSIFDIWNDGATERVRPFPFEGEKNG